MPGVKRVDYHFFMMRPFSPTDYEVGNLLRLQINFGRYRPLGSPKLSTRPCYTCLKQVYPWKGIRS